MTDHRADLARRLEAMCTPILPDDDYLTLREASAELRRPAAAEVEALLVDLGFMRDGTDFKDDEAVLVRAIDMLRCLSPVEEGWRTIVREWQDARKAVAQFDGVKDARVDGDFAPVLNRLANAESALAELAFPAPP